MAAVAAKDALRAARERRALPRGSSIGTATERYRLGSTLIQLCQEAG